MEFSDKLKMFRKEARLSQKDVAVEIGCSQSIISEYELGRKKPTYDVLVALKLIIKKYKVKMNLL